MWIVPLVLGGMAIWIAVGSIRVARWRSVIGTVRQIARAEDIDAWIVTFAFDEPGGWTSEATLTVDSRDQFAASEQVALRRNPMDPTQIETLQPRRIAAVLAVLVGATGLSIAALILG
ncbi:hypothetical protein AAFN86_15855 [Roseomonas sp. CAU 1739]|uniref:hypothetical protein n=1 Tax=Roseomonas sp. CAU 1739 TaxID=3140364 RepID=UPI00325BC76A